MNEQQFLIVKRFLGIPTITPQRLARAWLIPVKAVKAVAVCGVYEDFMMLTDPGYDPFEDLMRGVRT